MFNWVQVQNNSIIDKKEGLVIKNQVLKDFNKLSKNTLFDLIIFND